MQSRFMIVLTSIAGAAVLFGIGFALGLGVLTSPPAAQQHKQVAVADQPTKVTRPETTGAAAHDDRALTPLSPVAPGGALAAEPQSRPTAANSAPAAPQPVQQDAKLAAPYAAPAPQPQARADKSEPAPAPKNATPVVLQSRKACDIDACSRAYRSFRASDCTYQPYSGPRQLCVSPPGASDARADRTAHVRVHRGARSVDDETVTREAERAIDVDGAVDDGPAVRRYRRDWSAESEDDRIVVPANVDRGGWGDGSEDDDQ